MPIIFLSAITFDYDKVQVLQEIIKKEYDGHNKRIYIEKNRESIRCKINI
ncbi:hypothetical protein BC03BB108_C0225 (plasmid) [Bacillus cereus 03BB108]|nr:hypothetical protein BC03BB108_C0225 [Bacillus cereus 03BB108]